MNKKRSEIFDDVLKELDEAEDLITGERSQTRFLKRTNAMADQVAGARQEKVLRLVDPAICVMWEGHNRAYELLNAENCADLIEGMKAQGQQEFAAVVRRLRPAGQGDGPEYEVICGARRHFAVTWLRANNYPQFRYLIDERELTDEEAFRLADIENRDREDISDFERARDYARAVEAYYGGRQNLMAERLQVSPGFLSRFLQLARLEDAVVNAFATIRDIREVHVRQLRPLLADPKSRDNVLAEAAALAGQGLPAPEVLSRLKNAGKAARSRKPASNTFTHPLGDVKLRRKGNMVNLEFAATLHDTALREAVEKFIKSRKQG